MVRAGKIGKSNTEKPLLLTLNTFTKLNFTNLAALI